MANAFIVKLGQLDGHNPAAFQKSGVIAQAVLNVVLAQKPAPENQAPHVKLPAIVRILTYL
ncbi:hypothetical protein [Pseudochrobactrum sp. XF203]|uniref:hypothetical protein n=1 Tax=Pseudochrobactrum sp. XF203 TaxID=2879116 RepID=UPI001CE31968|nr:hypothetical protein [Pseudochrobactrum sp. XF203]UCA45262.1 hypothetical protein LDL70_13175 [Pseudochrobactrum sp. XF203]